ncbi:hypothetical protein GCWU000324_01985 [Kingella oralis ATCC 51147]|uniref:Lipoprotein n=1 Tax=Kingella oralis ATCC 51147 TaxID=629741 RepID=C4GIW3_9NEIS|nr:hypothetical protein GCWU000324_01985 [Kingella oralis ATCC 51147]
MRRQGQLIHKWRVLNGLLTLSGCYKNPENLNLRYMFTACTYQGNMFKKMEF